MQTKAVIYEKALVNMPLAQVRQKITSTTLEVWGKLLRLQDSHPALLVFEYYQVALEITSLFIWFISDPGK